MTFDNYKEAISALIKSMQVDNYQGTVMNQANVFVKTSYREGLSYIGLDLAFNPKTTEEAKQVIFEVSADNDMDDNYNITDEEVSLVLAAFSRFGKIVNAYRNRDGNRKIVIILKVGLSKSFLKCISSQYTDKDPEDIDIKDHMSRSDKFDSIFSRNISNFRKEKVPSERSKRLLS